MLACPSSAATTIRLRSWLLDTPTVTVPRISAVKNKSNTRGTFVCDTRIVFPNKAWYGVPQDSRQRQTTNRSDMSRPMCSNCHRATKITCADAQRVYSLYASLPTGRILRASMITSRQHSLLRTALLKRVRDTLGRHPTHDHSAPSLCSSHLNLHHDLDVIRRNTVNVSVRPELIRYRWRSFYHRTIWEISVPIS